MPTSDDFRARWSRIGTRPLEPDEAEALAQPCLQPGPRPIRASIAAALVALVTGGSNKLATVGRLNLDAEQQRDRYLFAQAYARCHTLAAVDSYFLNAGPAERAATSGCKSRRMMEDVSLRGPPSAMGFRPRGPRNLGPSVDPGEHGRVLGWLRRAPQLDIARRPPCGGDYGPRRAQ